ncbi:hypothetical protein ZIOFF_045200 [Zingiber officinale]|uniref:RRM domain-containing protein n=1 Tax=Zingiber officinale TaxID=94328 RepID=A0A8J5FZZ4_ZINOF|nr:hypothetical protein ZIOFF_045200 [Zingiber officinale]
MTIDDEKSIYVGGLPYECTQEDLHRAFDLYGAIMDVKVQSINYLNASYGHVLFYVIIQLQIVNDRHVGGKCYGFVTFRNPRSAVDAITDMNGRVYMSSMQSAAASSLRVKRVEEEKRERVDKEEEYGDRQPHKSITDTTKAVMDLTKSHIVSWISTGTADHQSRDISSNSSDDYRSQVRKEMKEQLELSIHRREELENEITIIGDKIEAKKLLISDLQKKSQELEDSLANAKKVTSQQQSMLMKLHSCYLQSQDLADRLKSSEQELQASFP